MTVWPGGNNLAPLSWQLLGGVANVPNGGYNLNAYDPASNPYGFENNGHDENFLPMLQNMCDVAALCAYFTAQAASAANQQTAWQTLTGTTAFVSMSSFTVTGNMTAILLPNGVAGRALQFTISGSPVYVHVQTATFSSGTGLTTVTLFESTLSAGWTAVQYGQDPNNDPYVSTPSNFTGDSGSGGAAGLVPAPAAGDAAASKYLKADGTWTAVVIPPAGGSQLIEYAIMGGF